jgi:tRNA nucleotidyltransferase/poly(A) polymerase
MRKSLKIQIPSDLKKIHSVMRSAGNELYLVGGAVRDTLLGKVPKDFDLATDAMPESVIKTLSQDKELKIDLTGKSFGVIRVKTPGGNEYEIATFREDIGSGRRPDSVRFTTIEDDVKRRDLTINALFYDLGTHEVIDLVGGIDDLKSGIIRAVGDPAQRFAEDKLRILRAARFAGRMGSNLDPETRDAIIQDNSLDEVTPERIHDEFIKGITSSRDVQHFLDILEDLDLFPQILPSMIVNVSSSTSNDLIVQLSLILLGNEVPKVKKMMKLMKYSGSEISKTSFLLSLPNITKDSAPGLKKEFNRVKVSDKQVLEFSSLSGTLSQKVTHGFLKFAHSPPAISPRDLMSQGLKGPEIGAEMSRQESEAYEESIQELRVLIRHVLTESYPSIDYNNSIIYCDMDGVLVDFQEGALKTCVSILDGTFGGEWVSTSKTMRKSISEINKKYGRDWRPTTSQDLNLAPVRSLMFSAISFAPGDFFASLGPFNDAITTLWPYLNDTGLTVNILSAPVGVRKSNDTPVASAGDGKMAWANNYLSPQPSEVIIRPARQKHQFAITRTGIPNILIDDKLSTINSWNDSGGIGILHEPGNSRKTIAKLKELGA